MEFSDLKELCSNKISDMADCIAGISSSVADLQESLQTGSSKEIVEVAQSHSQYVQCYIARFDFLEKELWNLFTECTSLKPVPQSRNLKPREQDFPKKEETNSASSSQTFAEVTSIKSENPVCLENYQKQMMGFYQIQNGDNRFIDFSGFYPKLRFTAGANPVEVREAYDFGMLGEVYLTTPEFKELSALPKWIKTGVQDNYENNPTIKKEDTLRLTAFDAGPDYDCNKKYPAFNFLILSKSVKDQITISGKRKSYPGFEDKDVHQRRAKDLATIKIRMENALKRPFGRIPLTNTFQTS